MEGHIELPSLGQSELILLWAVLASAFVALGYGWYLVRKVLAEDPGTPKMQEIAPMILPCRSRTDAIDVWPRLRLPSR